MSPLAEILRAEIEHDGPISFRRFMDAALYHPEHGYYRRERDPFGRAGDFYTAEQMQPVFGRLMAEVVGGLRAYLGNPEEFTVVELGAGRGEMAAAFSAYRYIPVDWCGGAIPDRFTGVVFANEFFDALPVHVLKWTGRRFHEMLVGFSDGQFVWRDGDDAPGEVEQCIFEFDPPLEEGMIVEANLDALRWIDTLARRLVRGFLLAIDYGYTPAELARFPQGTLMSYRRHTASPDVLSDPGRCDITAHVNFAALERRARRCGFTGIRRERLARTLLRAGERDEFASALAATAGEDPAALRLQLKTLLFGMGESFWTLVAGKGTSEEQ